MTESELQHPPTHAHNHLKNMGVLSWWPRYQLPGAKPSVFSWHPVKAPSITHEAVAPDTDSQGLLISVKGALPHTAAVMDSTAPQLATTSSHPARPPKKVLPFTLQLFFIPHQCWIINELPYNKAQHPLSPTQQQLLFNIIKALGLSPARWQEWRFHWPIAPRLEQARHAVNDVDAVQSFVRTQWAQSQDTLCHLFMGQKPCHYFPTSSQSGETPLTMPFKGHTLLSLDECLVIPGAKRQLWSDLKWLRSPIKRVKTD